jgi:hypothetical protein
MSHKHAKRGCRHCCISWFLGYWRTLSLKVAADDIQYGPIAANCGDDLNPALGHGALHVTNVLAPALSEPKVRSRAPARQLCDGVATCRGRLCREPERRERISKRADRREGQDHRGALGARPGIGAFGIPAILAVIVLTVVFARWCGVL